jgi:DNA-binding NarL/FixJ family response regulator
MCHADHIFGRDLRRPRRHLMVTVERIRVLLVDDHTMVRQGLRNVLQDYANIDVVGEAGNGEEAVESIAKLQPAVVVMDILMPGIDGIAATRLVKTNYPDIAVVGLTITPHSHHVEAMLKAGASEVVTKEHAVHELYSAIHRAIAAIQPVVIVKDAPLSEQPTAASETTAHPPTDVLHMKESESESPKKEHKGLSSEADNALRIHR